MRGFVITLVVLLAIVFGVDFAARSLAEDRVATQIQTALSLPEKPSVDINGLLFLPQAVAGEYADGDLTANDITYRNLHHITLTGHLQGVTLPLQALVNGQVKHIPTRTLTASARIDPADLARVLGVQELTVAPLTQEDLDGARAAARADPSGRSGNAAALGDVSPADSVRLSSTTSIMGQQLKVSVIASFRLSAGQIVLTARDIRVDGGGAVGQVAGSTLRARLSGFSAHVDPGQLPYGISATEMHADDGQLVVSGTARNVDLLRGG